MHFFSYSQEYIPFPTFMKNVNHLGNDWHLTSNVNNKMTNVKQMTRQWKQFVLLKTLKIDIIYMNQFESSADSELPLPVKIWGGLCNVWK